MKKYFIITTSLINENYEVRKQEYIAGINSLLEELKEYSNYSVIIVENNGQRKTFLNELFPQINIFYTSNNNLNVNKGIKELHDIHNTITNFNIGDENMIIKLTGRYLINKKSCFITKLMNNSYDCIVKLGSIINYRDKVNLIDKFDCYTGLFAIKCKYLKESIPKYLKTFKNFEWIEWIIISIIHTSIPNDKILFIDKLDLTLRPYGQNIFNII